MKKKILMGILLIFAFSFIKVEALEDKEELVCFYQLNDKGECEYVCVEEDSVDVPQLMSETCRKECW